jgi:hypothetical protein
MPSTTYRMTQGYVIAAADDFDEAPVPANSDRAARDYATVLRTDDEVVAELARAADASPADVRDRLEVGYIPGTGTLFGRYSAEKRHEVLAVMGELDRVLVVQGAPSGGISPGQARALGLAAVEEVPNRLNPFPGAGLIAVLLGATAAAVLYERLRPQVLDAAQLRQLSDRAVIDLVGRDALELLAFRVFIHGPSGVRVVALSELPAGALQSFAADLGATADAMVAAGDLPAGWGVPVLPVTGLDAEQLDIASSGEGPTWVLLVELPAPMRPVVDALAALRSAPDVVVVVGYSHEQASAGTAVRA